MRALPVALAAGLLLLAGLSVAPTASAGCIQVHNAVLGVSCVVCPTTNATELACGIERSANSFVFCFVDTAPSSWIATCV